MKNLRFTALIALTISVLTQSAGLFGQGVSKETRNLSSFKSIGVSGGFDNMILREGNTESIGIEAEGVALDKIETEVKDNTLKIGMKKGSYKNCKINLVVTYRSLESVATSGSTDVAAETPIRGQKFEFASSGSGDFKGEFQVEKLEIAISGSSDMKLSGRADKQEIAISGSGDVDASDLKGDEAKVAISGSGDVQLNVSRVKSSVSGSGHVTNSN